MSVEWLVFLNRIEAHVLTAKTLRPIKTFSNPLGRMKSRDLTYGPPGKSHDKYARSSHYFSMTGEKNPRRDVAIQFARQVINYLQIQLGLNNFDHLQLIADAKMLGIARGLMDHRLTECTSFKTKNWRRASLKELRAAQSRT